MRPNDPFRRLDHSPLLDLDTTIERLTRFGSRLGDDVAPPGIRPAAVLVGLIDDDGLPALLLTRRSQVLRQHGGEVSFPGGRLEPGEAPEAAAVREAGEEVGLPSSSVRLLGRLPSLTTYVSSSHVVPVVARIDAGVDLSVRNEEVDRVFTVRLSELVSEQTYSEERWGEPPDEHRVHFFYLDDETVWGVTARILYQVLSVTLAG